MIEKYTLGGTEVPTNTNNYDSYSSIPDIDTNYAGMNELYNVLNEASSNIEDDINKIRELLNDLEINWKGNTAAQTAKLLEEHLSCFSRYSSFYREMSELLNQSKNAYINFDESFENEII